MAFYLLTDPKLPQALSRGGKYRGRFYAALPNRHSSISYVEHLFISYRVPLGFVCGYPVGVGGEMYGGSMFARSASTDTQSRAIQSVNEKWGEGQWCGRETIGVAVCKKKYAPFSFSVVDGPAGKVVRVERMFGCRCHSDLRREKIELHGERKGWEPFGQWSIRKANELARRETERINGGAPPVNNAKLQDEASLPAQELISSDEELRTICNNGKCIWKMREKYDDVHRELTGYASSDAE